MTEDVARFVERFAAVLIDGGVPRMPARAFAALLATDTGRMTAAELAEALQASPAAVSGAVRYLTQTEPDRARARARLAQGRLPPRRRPLVRGDLPARAAARPLAARALDGVDAVGADTPAGARLQDSAEFFAFLRQSCPRMLARWREHSPRTLIWHPEEAVKRFYGRVG